VYLLIAIVLLMIYWEMTKDQWFGMVNDPPDYLVSLGGDKLREYQIAEFLRIHPFKDGNGRIAWILRTRFYDNWESPDPLPKYFPGE
jgi:fido (protein-threonine AMPylation protein)